MSGRAALILLLLAASGSTAIGAEDHRRVAVVEHRAGVVQLAGLAERLAAVLKQTAALSVVDPKEAHRRIPNVDSQVAHCAGGASCIAQLGVRLNVDEVLLVGISQLGDVVLTLQRIDVTSETTVGPHFGEALTVGEEPDDSKLLEWLKRLFPPEDFLRFGFIIITANVNQAEVRLNHERRGATPLAERLKVPAPASYRVALEKKGYAPFAARIDVLPDATVEVRAEMSPSEGTMAWYKRWYVWAIVGGVVAAGAIGAIVYAVRPDDQHVPAVVRW